ncbi:hypothetical protein ANCDUO_05388 [Ancylostoma duodenale]|uniref:Hyaluronidase n=1 Tax=Ancylostoma duodenale TaxID=51022 RepID=A0A0C2D481_9BILA|nr:hypothetical protein ANCDUO_05388 [Ancylostoma duodenale]
MDFIYNTTRTLYPSIYLNGKETAEQNFRFVRALLTETRRIAKAQRRRVNYYAYTKFEYDPYTRHDWFYEKVETFVGMDMTGENIHLKKDICNTMKLPIDLGGKGLVL